MAHSVARFQYLGADAAAHLTPNLGRTSRLQYRNRKVQSTAAQTCGGCERHIVGRSGRVLQVETIFANFARRLARVDGHVRSAARLAMVGDPRRLCRAWRAEGAVDETVRHNRADDSHGPTCGNERSRCGRSFSNRLCRIRRRPRLRRVLPSRKWLLKRIRLQRWQLQPR